MPDGTRLQPLLKVADLVKHFEVGGGFFSGNPGIVRAVDGVSFELGRNETLGIVGESGCGKSTLARTLLRLETPNSGSVTFEGRDIFTAEALSSRALNRKIQVVFQDPFAALSPRMSIFDVLTEPLRIHRDVLPRDKWPERVAELLERVGLRQEFANRFPHEFSGGQLQRIGIARALVLEPDLIILDEPVSALDVSIQAQVINLLEEVQETFGVAFICISHDLSVIRHISDRIAVMYLGEIVEIGDCATVYDTPAHPYTKALLSAEPEINLDRTEKSQILLKGEIPSPLKPPSGCRFRTRCWKATDLCREVPPRVTVGPGDRVVQCHFPITPDEESPT